MVLNEREIALAKAARWFGSGWGFGIDESPDMAVAKSRGQEFYENKFGTWCLKGGRAIADEAQLDTWTYFRFKKLDDYFECLRHLKSLDFADSWYEEREKLNARMRSRYTPTGRGRGNTDNLIRSVSVKS